MASALYLENFLETIEHLPKELQRNFSLMKDLDQRTKDTTNEVEEWVRDYKKCVASLSPSDRKTKLSKIDELYQKAKEYSDDKVQLAMQMYEMIDKHIRRLDSDLGRFEQELQLKDSDVSHCVSMSNGGESINTSIKGRKRSTDSVSGARKRRIDSLSDEFGSSPAGAGDVLDMPVDPNEPTYCLCHQVSFGEMIGCDNVDCPIEWFHFQCVGLTSKPKGKWFCPRCSQERDKHKKK